MSDGAFDRLKFVFTFKVSFLKVYFQRQWCGELTSEADPSLRFHVDQVRDRSNINWMRYSFNIFWRKLKLLGGESFSHIDVRLILASMEDMKT